MIAPRGPTIAYKRFYHFSIPSIITPPKNRNLGNLVSRKNKLSAYLFCLVDISAKIVILYEVNTVHLFDNGFKLGINPSLTKLAQYRSAKNGVSISGFFLNGHFGRCRGQ